VAHADRRERQLLLSALRSTVQLFLIGFVLKVLFDNAPSALGRAAGGGDAGGRRARGDGAPEAPLVGWWGFGVGTLSMFVSSFAVTVLALVVVVGTDPWYAPQYAIPLLGMILGNTMNGISLGLDRLTQDALQKTPDHRDPAGAR
jgi:putative ABC transport system permease protein